MDAGRLSPLGFLTTLATQAIDECQRKTSVTECSSVTKSPKPEFQALQFRVQASGTTKQVYDGISTTRFINRLVR